MAEKKFNDQVNYGWGLTLNMTGKAPAISKRIFDTYNDLLEFVNDVSDSAVEGLVLTVVNDTSNNGVYFVQKVKTENENSQILKLYTAEEIQPLIDGLNTLEATVSENEQIVAEALQSFYNSLEDLETRIDSLRKMSVAEYDPILSETDNKLSSNLEVKYVPLVKRLFVLGNVQDSPVWDYYKNLAQEGVDVSAEEIELYTEILPRAIDIEYTYGEFNGIYGRIPNMETPPGIDMTPFLKDDVLTDVQLVTAVSEGGIDYEGVLYEDDTKFLKFIWTVNTTETKTEYVSLEDIGVAYEFDPSTTEVNNNVVSVKIDSSEDNQLKVGENGLIVNEIVSDSVTTTKTIPVADGPLSTLLNNAGITEIAEGTDLQNLLFQLFCKELWPTNIVSRAGTITPYNTIITPTVSKSTSGLVIPGTTVTFTITQQPLKGYTSVTNKVSGFTYGYSLENDNSKDGDSVAEVGWNVSKVSETYTLTVSGTGFEETEKTGNVVQQITCSYDSVIGANTCTFKSYGNAEYSATIDSIPSYYGCSNIGNTREETKSTEIAAQDITFTDSGSLSNSSTITCVYPTYTNVSGTSLLDDATTQHTLTEGPTVTVSSIPSEERLSKPFIFDFPATKTISSLKTKDLPGKYNIYTNISGSTLSESADTSKGVCTTSTITFSNVPSEIDAGRFFIIEFPKSASVSKFCQYNSVSGKYEEVSYVVEDVVRSGDSYCRLKGDRTSYVGTASYTLNLTFPGYVTNATSDYNITSVSKEINGVTYEYSRLTTVGDKGFVDRQITLTSKLSIK